MAEKKRTTKKAAPKSTLHQGRKKAVFPEITPEKPEKKQLTRFLPDFFRFGESYSSLVLGIVVVIAVAALLVSFARNNAPDRTNQDTSSTNTRVTEQSNEARPGGIYVVEEGDGLWQIAERAYGDGNEWVRIAQANDIADPNLISVGTKLSIPETDREVALAVSMTPAPTATVTPTLAPTEKPSATPTTVQRPSPTIASNQQPTGPPTAVAGKSYTVVSGDTLWDIAERAYGSGYRWVEIAQANQLANPNLIFPGNEFQLPK